MSLIRRDLDACRCRWPRRRRRPPGAARPRRGGRQAGAPGPICLFSKHLPKMAARALAPAIKALGFTGIDLDGAARTGT